MRDFLYRPRTRAAARRRVNRALDRAIATSERRALEHEIQRKADAAFEARLWEAYADGRIPAVHLLGLQHVH